MKLWQGRFAEPTAADADAFNESLSFDKKLYKADITASLAHAEMLGRCGILSEADAADIPFLIVFEKPVVPDGKIVISFPFQARNGGLFVVDDQPVPAEFSTCCSYVR